LYAENASATLEKQNVMPEVKLSKEVVPDMAYDHYYKPFDYCKPGGILKPMLSVNARYR